MIVGPCLDLCTVFTDFRCSEVKDGLCYTCVFTLRLLFYWIQTLQNIGNARKHLFNGPAYKWTNKIIIAVQVSKCGITSILHDRLQALTTIL